MHCRQIGGREMRGNNKNPLFHSTELEVHYLWIKKIHYLFKTGRGGKYLFYFLLISFDIPDISCICQDQLCHMLSIFGQRQFPFLPLVASVALNVCDNRHAPA